MIGLLTELPAVRCLTFCLMIKVEGTLVAGNTRWVIEVNLVAKRRVNVAIDQSVKLNRN